MEMITLEQAKEDKIKNGIWSRYYYQDLEGLDYIVLKNNGGEKDETR